MIFSSPLFYPIPDRDSGVFLYSAEQMLHGSILYRDIWDHKPPFIFLINVIGLLIGDGSIWGIWFLEGLSVTLSSVVSFYLLRRTFGTIAAGISSIMCLGQLALLVADGNYTEVFALPFQFIAFYLFASLAESDCGSIKWILAGLSGGIVFFLRQNLIGVWISGILLILFLSFAKEGRLPHFLLQIRYLVMGILLIVVPIIVYFSIVGAIPAFWDAVFRYNFAYSHATPGLRSRLIVMILAILGMFRSGIGPLGIMGWVLGVVRIIKHRLEGAYLVHLALLDLPLEFILLGISGRNFPHYSISLLPALAILTSFYCYPFLRSVERWFASYAHVARIVGGVAFMPIFLIPSTFFLSTRAKGPNEITMPDFAQYQMTRSYILNSTTENDSVLIWGAEASMNFITKRKAPTRFVYQYPLFTKGYQSSDLTEEFLSSLKRQPPKLIIDGWKGTDKIPPLNPQDRAEWNNAWFPYYDSLPEIQGVYDFIYAEYDLVDRVGPQNWGVYRLKDVNMIRSSISQD